MRRFLYIFIILFLFKWPILQQISNILIHFLTFMYDIILRPFPLGLLGILIYFFDFILMLIFGSLPLYMIYPDYSDQIARIQIYILVGTIALSWIIIIGLNIRTVYRAIRDRGKVKKEEEKEELSKMVNDYLKNKISLTTLAKITGRRTDFRVKGNKKRQLTFT